MPLIKKYKAKVEKVNNPLPGIYTVSFSSNKKFSYLPGQFLHLAIDEYDGIGQWPESRCFSIQNRPQEQLIKITFAVKGNFSKRMVDELYKGKEVWLKLPYGDIFDRGHSKDNCVFIAGGTGITPFLSLFTHKSFAVYVNPKLYFGLRSEKFNIFQEELAEAAGINPSFEIKIVYQDKYGVLKIKNIYQPDTDSVYFISGPPSMIKYFKSSLQENGVAMTHIRTDEWE